MSSNLKVNTILPSSGDTVAISGIVSATSGATFSGIVTATSFSGSGANLTSIPAANLTGTLPAISGANLTGVLKNIVEDTSPQLGGNLQSNGNNINIVDSTDGATNRLTVGSGGDLQIYHNGSQSYVANSTGNLNLTSAGAVVTKVNTSEDAVVCNANGSVDLYHNNSKKVETTSTGLKMQSSSNQNIHLLKTSVQDTLIQNTGQTEICAATGGASGQRIVFRIGANTGSMPEIARFTPDGLCFGSDTAAVNALDDYEEGSFTPTFDTSISSGTIGSITYSMQAGHYTKIGDLVYVEGVLRANVTNNGTGTWDIAGLPFTCSNASGNAAILSCKDQASWVRAPDHFSVIGNDTRARARQGLNFGAGQYTNGQSDMFNAGSTSNNRVYFTGCYKAA